MLIQAKRRASLCPPQLDTESIPFRRNSYRNGEVWTPNDSKNHKKKDYVQKLEVIRQNSNFSSTNTSPELVTKKTANTLLTVPNDSDLKHMKKKSIDYKRNISNESIEFINIESMSPKVVANELTLIARQLFLSMKSTEIIALLIRPHSISPDSCSNIAALLGFQKRLIQLIPSYILKVIDNQICAQRIAYFIEVAKELKALENWHSVYSVILSLQSPPIARLRECWRIVSDDFSDSYCEFIEISEQIKREAEPLAHSSPSIPLFDEFIDDLKERCGAKYLEIKTHRLRSHWSTTDTIAVWVDKEIDHLIGVAKDKKKIQKKVENIRKSSVEMRPKKSILKKLMRRRSISSKEVSDSLSTGTDSRNDSIASLNTEKLKLRLMHEKGIKPSFKNIWSVADIQRLRDFEEKEILEEIVRGLVVYQRKANDYHLNESNQSVRDFLLLQPYKELDDCLKRSYLLEAKTLKKTSNQLIPAN
ncbi:unnamed protein product [Medioppia subpectinata]|uniref:Ras-GEF domain-containing protein n=1 Tax=Medioppia subpectinata TaxID=1979941 RepID=A0A7R9KNY2_9ACAR|nr:unnamed protein product [Medioppia subpectinata]CAG2106726.1 unnamed protein product [Medioppia subpectinata]